MRRERTMIETFCGFGFLNSDCRDRALSICVLGSGIGDLLKGFESVPRGLVLRNTNYSRLFTVCLIIHYINGEFMNRLLIVALAVAALAPSQSSSQVGSAETYTKGWANGRFWQLLDKQAKVACLAGVEAGINLFANEMMKENGSEDEWDGIDGRRNNLLAASIKPGDWVLELDKFYNDRLNIPIPVAYAYAYALKKITGESPEQLGIFLTSLRREWRK